MSVPGPSSRFLHYYDGTANLGVNLTGTDGQAKEFGVPAVEVALQDQAGPASTSPCILPVGFESSPDFPIKISADSTLQELIDDLHGVTAADRRDLRYLVVGWKGGSVAGQQADCGLAYLLNVKALTPQALLTDLECTFKWTRAAYTSALIMHALGAETADGDTKSAYIDSGAASTGGYFAIFGYTTYTPDSATGFLPRILDSVDHSAWTALATFTAVTATTGGGAHKDGTGTVKRYLACDWDFTGSPGAGATCTFELLLKRL